MAATTAVRARGAVEGDGTVVLPGDLDYSGFWRHVAFRFNSSSAAERSINLTLSSGAVGSFYGDGYGDGLHTSAFVLSAVLLTAGDIAPTAEGREFLQTAEGLAATQLTAWMFVGPFRDDHFTARDRVLGPELGEVNYSQTFPGESGELLRWQPLSVARGVAAPTAVRMPPAAAAQAANRTTAAVLSSHIFVPAVSGSPPTLDLTLSGSTSALAEITLGNATVVSDRLITGRTLSEFSRRVTLVRGVWTAVRVKAMQMSWACEWEMHLSVHAAGEGVRPVPGLQQRP